MHLVVHPIEPGLAAVGRAPDVASLRQRFAADDGHDEHMQRDIAHLLQRRFHLVAVRAVRIFKDRDLALAVAEHQLEGILERQILPVHPAQLVDAGLGDVGLGLGVEDLAREQKRGLGVGVENLGADVHFVQPGVGRLDDLGAGGQAGHGLLQRGAGFGHGLRHDGQRQEGRGQRGPAQNAHDGAREQ